MACHREHAPWPYEWLDVNALRVSGWEPEALREFVLKLHQRCNLACDYCYVYTMADQSWRSRPRTMSDRIWTAAADRIAEHVDQHGLDEVRVILHGGEPLLAGADRIAEVARTVRSAVPDSVTVRFALQTNGLLLTVTTLETLLRHDIRIGVSLDGSESSHDRHRRFGDGRGSFSTVDRGLCLLTGSGYRSLFSGLLATIDPATDPVECYEAMLRYEPPALDLLLPHANWSAPPGTLFTGVDHHSGHPFGDWLIRLFDRWYDAPRQEARIRLFEEIINAVLGGASQSEDIGLSPAVVAVVETDGAIEQADALKSAYHGAASTGLSVLSDSFDAALAHPGMIVRQIGIEALSDTCRQCDLHLVCGGGQYPHRYRADVGFWNPSVYCEDLGRIISHIRQRVLDDIGAFQTPNE